MQKFDHAINGISIQQSNLNSAIQMCVSVFLPLWYQFEGDQTVRFDGQVSYKIWVVFVTLANQEHRHKEELHINWNLGVKTKSLCLKFFQY